MNPMLREDVELEEIAAEDDPCEDFSWGDAAVHRYAANAAGERFAIGEDIYHALLLADGRGPLALPPELSASYDDILQELILDGLLQTSRFIRSEDRFNRFVLFMIPERTPNIASFCRGIHLTLPIAAPLFLIAGLVLQFLPSAPPAGGDLLLPLYYALLLLSLFLHEIGHCTAGLAYGYPLRDLSLLFYGYFPIGACVACQQEEEPHLPREQLSFCLAGVEVNLLLSGVFLLLFLLFPPLSETFRQAAWNNLLLFAVNALPASQLDGEAALSALLGVDSAADTAGKWLGSRRLRRKLLQEGGRGLGFFLLFVLVRAAQAILFAVIALDVLSPLFGLAAFLYWN